MKRIMCFILSLCACCTVVWAASTSVKVTNLSLEGEITGENIVFTLNMNADVADSDFVLPLVIGDVAYLNGDLPHGSTLLRDGNKYSLKFGKQSGFFKKSSSDVKFIFASRAEKEGEWRKTSFVIPSANIRKISVICDRNDLEVQFPGALDVKREKTAEGKTQITAYLGVTGSFEVRWKPEVKKLDSELVVACDANTIATASVGALRLDTVFSYRVIQGMLEKITMDLPNVNVTQVNGVDVQDWQIDKSDPSKPKLVVSLSRPQEDIYRLQVESEMVLPQFPCGFDLPVIAPVGVIRTSGFLFVGADSAIKMKVNKASGLTQVDQGLFPSVAMTSNSSVTRIKPNRSVYAYQYASAPYTLSIGADDIVTSFTADNRFVLSMRDNDLTFEASLELDIKDAPARDVRIKIDTNTEWTVTSVAGQYVSDADTDVREEDGNRFIYIPFTKAVEGTTLINVRMEKTLRKGVQSFAAPKFEIVGAKSERGYLVVAAEKGLRLKVLGNAVGLREVHTGSAPMRIVNAQQAFRFKSSGWSIAIAVERTLSTLYSESFNLVSIGEGVMYCSAAITYHVTGAPIQEFVVKVPKDIELVEFTGADIEGWTRDGDLCTIRLQAKIMGDYTLLATYDKQFDYENAALSVGGIETVGCESEVGYIALASSASLSVHEDEKLPAWIIPISREEIPVAYSSTIADPILKAFKYVHLPHAVKIFIKPFETEQLLGQIADYIKLSTKISKDGDSETTVTYYIKNVSRQYLVVTIPKDVKLWYVKYVDEDGKRRDASSQRSGQDLLIPVQRPRQSNTPIQVEIKYAQKQRELGFFKTGFAGMEFIAPSLKDTHAVFAEWALSVPENWSIVDSKGNMSSETSCEKGGCGFFAVLVKSCRIVIAVLDGRGGLRVKNVLKQGWGGARYSKLVKTVNLAGDAPMAVKMRVVPAWVGCNGSVVGVVVSGLLGIILCITGLLFRRSTFLTAFGLTLLLFAMSETAMSSNILAVIILCFVILLLWNKKVFKGLFLIFRWIFRAVFRLIGSFFRLFSFRKKSWLEEEIDMEPFEEGDIDVMNDDSSENKSQVDGSEDKSGFVSIKMILLLFIGLFAIVGPVVATVKEQPYIPVMDNITISVKGPSMDRNVEQSAVVNVELMFHSDKPTTFLVVPASCVLKKTDFNSRYLSIVSGSSGYMLNVDKEGSYKVTLNYQVPVVSKNDGMRVLSVLVPENMKNKISFTIPEPGMEINLPEGVLFSTKETKTETIAEAVLGPARTANFTWRPRVRKTNLERSVYYCEVNTLLALRAGVVDLASVIRYQIAQGEVGEMKLVIPEGMTVTAVKAKGLATWSFDPKSRELDAILEKPVSGDLVLTVVTQIACEGLPYRASISVPKVMGASRQRGSIAFGALASIQVKISQVKGLSAMNIEDFAAGIMGNNAKNRVISLRKAFRYNEVDEVAAVIDTEQVLPEIRVNETALLDISDERITLSSKLSLEILKAGVFSVELGIPEGFDVETLTGPDVSHWDEMNILAKGMNDDENTALELGSSETKTWHGVVVYFNRQVTAETELNLVVARMGKGVEHEGMINVPRIVVKDARKHKGKLTISGELGVRMMVENHRGVDLKKASEEGITQAGVLVFDLLRPSWMINLKTDIMQPLVKPEVLQIVDLAEGVMQCRVHIKYKIENAGIKTFLLKSPMPGITLAVTGQNISRVQEVDKDKGIWCVDLHDKVENGFSLNISYQVPYDTSDKRAVIKPLETVDTEGQRGYLVLTCAGRLQVKAVNLPKGLKIEDPRNIPAMFSAGDLSSAIQCYRTIRSDYELDLSVVRHDAADVLPASINHVHIVSAMSSSQKLLTHVELKMIVSDLRLLKMKLPNNDDSLWSVLVDGRAVSVSRDNDLYCIPLEEDKSGRELSVDIVYAGSSSLSHYGKKVEYVAPTFGLPMNDISWDFYVMPELEYYGFGGTMSKVDDMGKGPVSFFDTDTYMRKNRELRDWNWSNARSRLDAGEELLKHGQQTQAKKVFQEALNYSQGQADLSEDARVQLRNVVKQQVKMGLVNRRDAVRFKNNLGTQDGMSQSLIQGGDYTQQYVNDVEKRLSSKDNDALDTVADKMIEQQAAAAGVVTTINITLPENGKKLSFHRDRMLMRKESNNDKDKTLDVVFTASNGYIMRIFKISVPFALVFILLWIKLSSIAYLKESQI